MSTTDGIPIESSSDDTVTVSHPLDCYVENAPAIEDVFADLAKEVPAEEWDKLPADLTDRLDDYLYDDVEGGR